VHGPEDTEWGKHEGAVVDPDGNVIRFGSGVRPAARPEAGTAGPAALPATGVQEPGSGGG